MVAVRVFSAFSGFFGIFFRLTVLKCIQNEILNSWEKEKLSTKIKLNQQYCILQFDYFSEVTLLSLLALLSFILFLEMYHFSGKMSLRFKRPCLWIKLRKHFSAFLPFNFDHVFVLEYIVESLFVPFLKSLSWALWVVAV